MKVLVGIDEVGRGPLAGPVAVGVVVIPRDFDWSLIPGVGDSKQVKPKYRDAIFNQAKKLRQQKVLNWQVTMVTAEVIDKKGIVFAINQAMEKSIKKLNLVPEQCQIKLDGSLKAPIIYKFQETIIKGDSKEKVIGLASIVAKVTRDQYMERLGSKAEYLIYDFATNKGYGTLAHRQAIKKNGLSIIHRQSFCRRLSK